MKGFIRGTVHVCGYIVTERHEVPGAIHVVLVSSVDPAGRLPKWIADGAKAEVCRKLARIRNLCEANIVAEGVGGKS